MIVRISHLHRHLDLHRPKLVTFVVSIVIGSLFGISTSFAAETAIEPPKVQPAPTTPEKTPEKAPEKTPAVSPAPAPLVTQEANYFGKKVSQIQIRGLKRIEKEAVLAKIGAKVGSPLTKEQVRLDIQAIFNMGFFEDIAIEAEIQGTQEVSITYVLRERPVISKIEFDGNERIGSSDLKDVIKMKEWAILDINKVREDVNLIQKHYEEKGFYLAKVSYDVKVIKADEVSLVYKINDYDKVQIKKITFLNNKRFTDEQLKSVFGETREGGPLSFISGSGNFKESAFKQDLQRLTYWYLDHGYVKFKYENPVVTVSDDKKWLYISIYVDEGVPYQMANLDFGGDLLFTKEELHKELTLKSEETFSISKRNQDIQRLTEKYQDLGYAFVNVIPRMNVHEENKTLDIEYAFEKGNLVHFGEINVLGNSKTYDKVIRRELKIHEGELYSGTNMRLSRENVERLGYFAPGEVIFNTVSVKGKPDVLNVEISIKERSTGTITLGAGYGSYQGFFFTAQISEINLFGRGQTLSLAGQYSIQQLSQSVNLGFTDNFTFDTLWSTGFDVYWIKFPIPYRYTVSKLGFDIRVGHPIAEYTSAFITYKLEGVQDLYPLDDTVTPEIIAADSGIYSTITWSVVRDKRNNRFETTGGNYQSASVETAGIWGDKEYVKWNVNNRVYFKVIGDLVFRNSIELGQIVGMGGKPIPPSQKFYLGGPNNMKGYSLFLLGPTKPGSQASTQPLGGTAQGFALFELEYPVIKEAGIKLVTFFDAGNTWFGPNGEGDPFPRIRTDAGFGIRWFSPIGPLRFEWGFPLNPRDGIDQSSVFQFFIGPPF